ncbi:LYR motif-containing protein 2 isoform X1 [Melospiza georgiana]|uniref:LYR motif-containing protein 2 isoform X1 n=1 Tax=Melospiza georgiana TaxID=44398 RepID=UPI0025AC901A|nr:LYR motif-containing protein 2 isoform X1 [Melospiza georgiana]
MGNSGCLNTPQNKAPRVQRAAVPWGGGQTSLSLWQFLRRQQVLQLYRKILRAIREVPAEQDRRYLRDWAREEFKRNKDATEEDAIRMMITQGNMQLQELQRTIKLAKS